MAEIASSAHKQLQDAIALAIAEKNSQIRELLQERESLERLLTQSRQQDAAIQSTDVTRKNSINRIVIEGAVLKAIKNSKSPLQSKNLYKAARFMVPDLPENTFRSYLHRLKSRGLIEQSSRGNWKAGKGNGAA